MSLPGIRSFEFVDFSLAGNIGYPLPKSEQVISLRPKMYHYPYPILKTLPYGLNLSHESTCHKKLVPSMWTQTSSTSLFNPNKIHRL